LVICFYNNFILWVISLTKSENNEKISGVEEAQIKATMSNPTAQLIAKYMQQLIKVWKCHHLHNPNLNITQLTMQVVVKMSNLLKVIGEEAKKI